MIDEVVVTLYEGHYHYGVAALINSLATASFEGLVLVGYKGILPPWINQLQKEGDNYHLQSRLRIRFQEVITDMHFGYYKPSFLLQALEENESFTKAYYFDPDIVVNAPWKFFSKWVESGVALCLDVSFAYLHTNHPWRTEWKKLAAPLTIAQNDIDFYANSGFIGIHRADMELLNKWKSITALYKQAGMNVKKFEQSTAHSAFKGDQDLLNATITVAPEFKFSIIGKEGMGFAHPAYLMSHAIGDGIKPWKRQFVKSAILYGAKPALSETDFYKYVKSPIVIFKKGELKSKLLSIKVAKIITRFWKS